MIGFSRNEGRKSILCAIGNANGKEQYLNTLKPCNAQIPKITAKEKEKEQPSTRKTKRQIVQTFESQSQKDKRLHHAVHAKKGIYGFMHLLKHSQ